MLSGLQMSILGLRSTSTSSSDTVTVPDLDLHPWQVNGTEWGSRA